MVVERGVLGAAVEDHHQRRSVRQLPGRLKVRARKIARVRSEVGHFIEPTAAGVVHRLVHQAAGGIEPRNSFAKSAQCHVPSIMVSTARRSSASHVMLHCTISGQRNLRRKGSDRYFCVAPGLAGTAEGETRSAPVLSKQRELSMNDNLVSAVFDNHADAERAVSQLRNAGVQDSSISLIAQRGDAMAPSLPTAAAKKSPRTRLVRPPSAPVPAPSSVSPPSPSPASDLWLQPVQSPPRPSRVQR